MSWGVRAKFCDPLLYLLYTAEGYIKKYKYNKGIKNSHSYEIPTGIFHGISMRMGVVLG